MPYGTLLADVIQTDTAGVAPQFNGGNGVQIGTLCRAWVNFNGTGTVAIRASFNVSSITDNGTGDYTVNFTTALPDANYSAVFSGADVSSGRAWGLGNTTPTASAIRIISFGYNGGALSDTANSYVAVFR
jgi:hypothetical protein